MTIVNCNGCDVPEVYLKWVDVEKIGNFDDWLRDLTMEVDKCNVSNDVVRRTRMEAIANIGSGIRDLYGEKSKMYRYWKNNHLKELPSVPDLDSMVRNLKERHDRVQEEKRKKESSEKRSKKYIELTVKAVIFLQKNGIEPGTYSLEDAINKANGMRFDQLVGERVNEHNEKGTYFDFDGQNCDGPCEGWDGFSHRCECGNRRVAWSSYGDFSDMHIYGDAY